MKARQIVTGMLALVFVAVVTVPVQAQVLQRNRVGGSSGYGGTRNNHRVDRHNPGRSHQYRGGGPYFDGGLFLGVLGLGILLDAIAESQPPVVVYEPQRRYWRSDLQPGYEPADPPYDPREYPTPKRYYPECKQFLGNPGAMAFCEKGVLERENEEQRELEQKAYDAGRGR